METAGTSLRGLFTNLAKPTDAMAAAMKKYNISLTDSEGQMKSLDTVIRELRTVFQGLSQDEQAALAATLANKTGKNNCHLT